MKIKKLKVKNFRSLKDLEIEFNENITCIVGENDAGKSSILDCIRIFSNDYYIDKEDFSKNGEEQESTIEVSLHLSNGISLYKKFKNEDNQIKKENKCFFLKEDIEQELSKLEARINNENIQEKKLNEIREDFKEIYEELKDLASKIIRVPRDNSKISTVLHQIKEKINSSGEKIESNQNYTVKIYHLEGTKIEKPENIIRELFFKDIQTDIWKKKISDKKTIREVIENEIDKFINGLSPKITQMEKEIKKYIHNLKKIDISYEVKPQALNFSMNVSMIDNNDLNISTEKKGDGTKRRITMALLNLKLQEKNEDREIKVFLFDEPDTHLHVKAQRDLLKILKEYSKDKQIIITTHSPFIINSLKPTQIKFISLRNNISYIRNIKEKNVDKLLYDLGIENISLFFARKILITEGKTEKVFLENLYYELENTTTYGDFIKIIDGNGITDTPRLAKVLLENLDFPKKNVFILLDKDLKDESPDRENIKEIINKFVEKGWNKNENLIILGNFKEFEDLFPPEHIFEAWKIYVEKRGGEIGENWTKENIQNLKKKCKENGKKFSEELKKLNKGCKCKGIKFNKSETFPKALAEYYSLPENKEKLPKVIKELLDKLKED